MKRLSIEEEWEDYKAVNAIGYAKEEVQRQLRDAFISGAAVLMGFLNEARRAPKTPETAQVVQDSLHGVNKQLMAYVNEQLARRKKP